METARRTPALSVFDAPEGARIPLVFDSPHSGTDYPADFRPALPMAALRKAEDMYVDDFYAAAPEHGAALLLARFPRVYLDANRSVEDMDQGLLDAPWPGPLAPGVKTECGLGLIWRLSSDAEPIYDRRLSVEEAQARIDRCHAPYHAALKSLLDARHAEFGRVYHVDCHSMPELSGPRAPEGEGVPRADFVLGDRDGATCAPEFTRAVAECLAGMGYEVAVNDPYKGVELVRAYSDPAAGRHSLQVEINRRLYMNETTFEKTAGYAATKAAVGRLMATVAAFARSA
ncbi:putative hydrolase [uncultured Alphaproteobacteria bacterium]|uniref:Putative hydrolase n=1 Tax=uncultured Alphaproteobacteria bacterium TaxID=91750 RepID=A0A212KGU3_9PROT|nr:putative hydrolase [uncultured Alphaproteobacteria bacterium]